eukprot:3756513-Prorocentrum_lima.AAC.1
MGVAVYKHVLPERFQNAYQCPFQHMLPIGANDEESEEEQLSVSEVRHLAGNGMSLLPRHWHRPFL